MKTKEEVLNQYQPNQEYPSYYHESNVLEAMEEYAAQFVPQWIKINSEADLPEELTRVLIHSSSMGIILAYHHKSAWRVPLEVREGEKSNPDDDEYICSTKSKSITHYTVLPQKPKED